MRSRSAALAVLALLVALPATAVAQSPGSQSPVATAATATSALTPPERLDAPPAGHRLTGQQVEAIAARVPKVIKARRKYPRSYPSAYLKGPVLWQASFFSRDRPPKEIAQVYIDDASGRVTEAWTGPQVAWTMARGYPGAFGRKVNSPWVWMPLTLLFVVPFVDPRRLWRALHLDLLVLAAFGVSVAFFNDANIDVSVPLVYPLLVYLLARMLWIGLRRPAPGSTEGAPLRLLVPVQWLAVALVFLTGFRIGLNLTNSNVIDVGYAGVIGADKITHLSALWGHFPSDNPHGDTYGPLTYLAYVPFELVWPWHGRWDDLPAAHAAAVTFDLSCMGLLFLIGRRLRGPWLGVVLAYVWAAYPFTLYALDTNVNDALAGVLVLAAIAFAISPTGRGAFVGLAGMAKFAPLALAPLFIAHRPRRRALAATLACGAVVVAGLAFAAAFGGLHTFFDRTISFQASRGSPFSIWGQHGWHAAQVVVQAGAALLAVAVALVPRRRDVIGLAALAAAVLIALQLGVTHWFYLYIVWFFPPVMVAVLGFHPEQVGALEMATRSRAPAPAPALSPEPASARLL